VSLVDVFFAAAVLGAWVIGPAALFTAGWAAVWAGRWVWRIGRAAVQWKRDVQTDPDGSSIDDDELADWLALWAAPYDPQTGLDRLRHEIKKHREEEDR
jgi:hypothetical protein